MYALETIPTVVTVPLRESGTFRLKHLIYKSWWHVDVGYRIVGTCSFWEADALEYALKGLKGIARLQHEQIDRERLWQKTLLILHRLMEAGWKVYSGISHGVLSIVLTNGDKPGKDGAFRAVQIPPPAYVALEAINACVDALALI